MCHAKNFIKFCYETSSECPLFLLAKVGEGVKFWQLRHLNSGKRSDFVRQRRKKLKHVLC